MIPMRRTVSRIVFVCLLAALPSACSMFDEDKDAPLPGKRISVLELQKDLEPDDGALKAQGFIAPTAWKNDFWPQAGGYPNHSMQNLELNAGALKEVWSADIGDGSRDGLPLTAQPVVVEGKVFTLDTDSTVRAFSIDKGKQLWERDVRAKDEDDPVIGGGLSYSDGVLYVTSGYDELLALKPEDGKIVWRTDIKAPSRAAPTVINGRIFVTTLDNRLLALSTEKGKFLWDYAAISETTGLVGAASAAVDRDIVVPVFSSGDIDALRIENGSVAWSDNLAALRSGGGLADLGDIRGLPVIDKDLVFAISFSGKLAAIDARTGTRVWQREIGGSNTPWLAGNYLFVLTEDDKLVGLGRDSGSISWVTQLDKGDADDPVLWTGPVLAGGRLIVAGSGGRIAEIAPETGKIVRQWSVDDAVSVPPVVAGGMLYLLTDDGTLKAYR